MSNTTAQDEAVLEEEILLPPKRYGVYLLNDDYTPMDFVVQLLQKIFLMDFDRAESMMWEIHRCGSGLCGRYSLDVAQTKKWQVDNAAGEAGHPLQCVIEVL